MKKKYLDILNLPRTVFSVMFNGKPSIHYDEQKLDSYTRESYEMPVGSDPQSIIDQAEAHIDSQEAKAREKPEKKLKQEVELEKQAASNVKTIKDTKRERIERERTKLRHERSDQTAPLEAEKEINEQRIKDASDEVHRMNGLLESLSLEKFGGAISRFWMGFLTICVSAVDVPFLMKSVETLLDTSPTWATVATIFISFILATASKAVGKNLQLKNKKLSAVWIASTISLLAVFIGVRLTQLDAATLVSGSVLVILSVVTAATAYSYHESNVRKTIKAAKAKLLKSIAKMKKENALFDHKLNQINQGIEDDATKNVESELKDAENKKADCSKRKADVQADIHHIKESAAKKKAEVKTRIKTAYTKGQQSQYNLRSIKAAAIAGIILFTTACTDPLPVDVHNLIYLRDQSGSTQADFRPTAIEEANNIMRFLGIDENGMSSEEVNLYVTKGGDYSLPEVTRIHLSGTTHWMLKNRDQRTQEVKEFKEELIASLTAMESAHSETSSHLWRPICRVLDEIPEGEHCDVWITSDFLENGVIDMVDQRFLKNPDLYRAEYLELKRKLIDDTPAPENIRLASFTLVTFGTVDKQAVSYRAVEFFERVLEDEGALDVRITAKI